MKWAVIASGITCLSHTATLSVCLTSTATELEPLVWQVRPILVRPRAFERAGQPYEGNGLFKELPASPADVRCHELAIWVFCTPG